MLTKFAMNAGGTPWMVLATIVVTAVFSFASIAASDTVYEGLRHNPELSEFFNLVNKDEVLQVLLDRRTVTIYAPTNDAIRKYPGRRNESLLPSFHVANILATRNIFPASVHPYLAGAPPLFLTTKKVEGSKEKEYFVNNAKIISSKEYRGTEGGDQLLYIIDELLEAYNPASSRPPTALDFLNQPSIYNIKENFGAFRSRVISDHEKELFRRVGNHTFFLPVGEGDIHNYNRLQSMDMWVVRGHVIPKAVLFTRAMESAPYPTEAFTDTLKVVVSLVNETDPDTLASTLYAQSNTILPDQRHRKGVVRAKIIKPNIPVSNGVVHLIQAPLMIIDKTISDYIQDEKHGRLSEFFKLVHNESEFVAHMSRAEEKTVLAPTNEAIRALPLETREMLRKNITALTNLLQLHMVMKSISTADVGNHTNHYLSLDNKRRLYFRAIGPYKNRTLTVEGGGVNATAVQADMGTTNGIVHIIDRVLGMPYMTLFRKLKNDPDLKPTFQLGEQDQWVRMLDGSVKNYTFFVPSRNAWEDLAENMPTEHKQLNMGIYTYHVKKILERHLVVGQVINSQELAKIKELQTVNSIFKILKGHSSEGGLDVEWEGITAHIVRADVQATNGVIHVIDRVLMKRRDLTKGEASRLPAPSIGMFSLLFLLMLL